ncbi:hypothetical protein GYMLUDRAFT_244813 [Collybiopsis luxurians FD-317 M1]|uniref:Uncharacterized protein n=1 Tax=Collybiopsis luxurians FD-317 M1 TaxID=944289 RepID=A0A0D0BWQ9_9AGAR|nr:hypothetical protein GYMLUDRAFT_244813 [Collybiopsis luxurians FD-317 M1]
MSASQSFPNQPTASSSNLGGLRPRLILKVPQSSQSVSLLPFLNALPSAPPTAKKIIPPSLPTGLQPIYEDVYLANSSPEVLDRVDIKEWRDIFRNYPSCEYCASHNLHSTCSLCPNSLLCTTCEANYPSSKKFCSFKSVFWLLQFHILAKLPFIVAYCIVSSRGLFIIWGKEWTALTMGLQNVPYYRSHPEELGLPSDGPRVSEGKWKAVISSNAFRKSQLLREERGKEVIRDPVDVNVEMGVLEELDGMNLEYLEEAPPPSTPVWKAVDTQSYSVVSGLTTWFFEPLVKRVPSNGSSLTRDKMVKTAVECVVMRMASLFAGPGKKMLKQDLWSLVDGLIQGAFNGLEEQLQHSPSKPPASFSSKSLLQFVESLTVVNMTSANIVDSQQDKLL